MEFGATRIQKHSVSTYIIPGTISTLVPAPPVYSKICVYGADVACTGTVDGSTGYLGQNAPSTLYSDALNAGTMLWPFSVGKLGGSAPSMFGDTQAGEPLFECSPGQPLLGEVDLGTVRVRVTYRVEDGRG